MQKTTKGKTKILLNMSRAIGIYGTCAVKIEDEVAEANWHGQTRRSFSPDSPKSSLCLAD
jgi:hypothetical protein